jgi:hypothetical protein
VYEHCSGFITNLKRSKPKKQRTQASIAKPENLKNVIKCLRGAVVNNNEQNIGSKQHDSSSIHKKKEANAQPTTSLLAVVG